MKVIIDPRFQINYSSYYIQGLIDLFGEGNIRFEIIEEIHINCLGDYRKGMAFLLVENEVKKRLFIDTWDSDTIHKDYYRWSDLYAKINVRKEDSELEKLLVVGPSFGVQVWKPIKTMTIAFINYYKSRRAKGFLPSMKDYLLNYAYTFVRRLPLNYYLRPYQEDDEYVFTLNTLWYDERTYATTNRYRGHFARICQRIFTRFEGGFFYIPSSDVVLQFPKYQEYIDKYRDIIVTRRVGMKEYLKKLRRSALAFNTPSVSGCHGWKLGEYLAMGKAIVSMPLNNEMPIGWENGLTHLEVKSKKELEQAIRCIQEDKQLHSRLKEGATHYFTHYLSPSKVILTIVHLLFPDEAYCHRSHI